MSMTITDLCCMGAKELAEAIRSRHVSSREVVEAHLRRIAPSPGAMTSRRSMASPSQSRRTSTSRAPRRPRASRRCWPPILAWTPVIERMRLAGAIPIGRTNCPNGAIAAALNVDLVVLGSRGLGPVRRLVLGSVSEEVAHSSPCPILVLRGGEEARPPARVVIGDDGSGDANRTAELVVESRGLGTWERLRLGSTSSRLLHAVPCPVLVCRHRATDQRFSRSNP